MSKKMLKRSLVLGALMAFVITGNAMAESITVNDGYTKDDIAAISVNQYESFKNAGTVKASESVTIYRAAFNNTGTIETKVFDYYDRFENGPKFGDKNNTFGGTITAANKFIYRGLGREMRLDAKLTTATLHIIAQNSEKYPITDSKERLQSVGLVVGNNEVLSNVGSIIVDSNGAQAVLVIQDGANVKYDNTITLKSTDLEKSDARIELYNDSSITLDNLVVDGPEGKVQYSITDTSAPGSTEIKNIEIYKDSSLDLCYYAENYASESSSTFTFNEIAIGDNGSMYAVVNGAIQPNLEIKGDIKMNLGKNTVVDFGAYKKQHADWLGNKMLVNASSMTINTTDGTAEVYLSNASTSGLKNENIKVVSTATLDEIKDVVWRTEEAEGKEGTEVARLIVAEGVQLVQQTNSVEDTVTGTVAVDPTDSTKSIVTDISSSQNSTTFGVAENNALSLITWRAEINDMNKRMGELRNANGEHGVWVRMVRGEDEYESINHQYNQYQLGYDEKLSVDPSWTVGVALSYTEGDSTYSTGSAENKHKGFSVYGSKLNDDGTFIDLIAKYARLENDFDTTWGTGDYSTNGYSVSAEFGKRIQQGKGVWVEPQVELTYGKVSAVDYKIGNVAVAQDGIESLVGRVGFSLGKDIKQGNVYARASYLYDFDGETSANFVDTVSGGNPRTLNDDLGGGWWEVGVGANINLSKATYIYADVEKTFGGEVDTNWQWNLGVRYSF